MTSSVLTPAASAQLRTLTATSPDSYRAFASGRTPTAGIKSPGGEILMLNPKELLGAGWKQLCRELTPQMVKS